MADSARGDEVVKKCPHQPVDRRVSGYGSRAYVFFSLNEWIDLIRRELVTAAPENRVQTGRRRF